MRLWIRDPLALFTANDHQAPGGLVIEDNLIVELLAAGTAPASPVDETFDAREHVVLPGLVNAHQHFHQTLTRAWGPAVNMSVLDWLPTLYPLWSRLTPEHLMLASRLALAELLLSGCTTSADHHYLFPAGLEQAIDIQIDAVRELGMRATLCRGSINLAAAHNSACVQSAEAILADSQRLAEQYHERSDGAQIRIALAPSSPFAVTRELMRDSAKLARKHDLRLHTHLGETPDEQQASIRRFGMRSIDYLKSVGWLGPQTWLAHGIHFNQIEIASLGRAGVGICHCPSSNMRLGSGICRALQLEQEGATIGLGVDGAASNDTCNMLLEARQALLLQRLRYGAEQITPHKVLGWATRGSARLLGRSDIGQIAPGKQADLALFKLDELRFSGSHDPLAALLLCGADRADRVMIGGRWRVIDGQIEGFDLERLKADHRQAALQLAGG
ncbi:8-oxoguanine deaminase [Pseudomonas saudiphocaensis]|uniref:8-oxoguanine deaminase n=1 Tax=Pseudomonas saudiphocaensis TaxID=1499686 RepID=UPI00187D47FF|nr:8-oxoguanine deaminase [Pseudomonas saudiphocaensis]MBE7927027.1 8-oxoguanine deaminase [Pseudomonas saudiphocaensis]